MDTTEFGRTKEHSSASCRIWRADNLIRLPLGEQVRHI